MNAKCLEVITCTAWDLVGDYNELIDVTHEIFTENGRIAYHSASATPSLRSVRIERFNNNVDGLWIVRRYLNPDDQVKLMPIKNKQKWQTKIDITKSLSGLRIIAKDLITVVSADYDVWMKKVDEARTMTQLRIVSADLLDIW